MKINTESEVRKRYAAGARMAEEKLCCPVEYKTEFLEVIPQEVIRRPLIGGEIDRSRSACG